MLDSLNARLCSGFAVAAGAILALAAAAPAQSQATWPTKTVRVIVVWPPRSPGSRTVRAGSSPKAVPIPTMIASWVERITWTRRSAIGPVMRRRAS